MMMLVITLILRIILDDIDGDRDVKAKYSQSSADCMILNRPIDKYCEQIFYDNFQKIGQIFDDDIRDGKVMAKYFGSSLDCMMSNRPIDKCLTISPPLVIMQCIR